MASARHITIEELGQGLAASRLGQVEVSERERAIAAASSECESYAAARYALPLPALCDAAKRHIADVAVYLIIRARGFDPEGPDQLLIKAYEEALAYFRRIASGEVPLLGADGKPVPGAIDGSGTTVGAIDGAELHCDAGGEYGDGFGGRV